jgi:hypothetical protein
VPTLSTNTILRKLRPFYPWVTVSWQTTGTTTVGRVTTRSPVRCLKTPVA